MRAMRRGSSVGHARDRHHSALYGISLSGTSLSGMAGCWLWLRGGLR